MAHQAAAHGPCALPHPTWSDPLPLQTQPQNRVPPLAHPYLNCAPQGGCTFSDRLGRLTRLDSASHIGRSPPTAWNGLAPTQILAVSDPGTPPVHPLLRCYWRLSPAAKNPVGVSKAIHRSRTTATPPQRRWATARPLPKHPQKEVAPGGNPPMGAPPGGAHLGSNTQ